jgi:hypothetical protein
MSDTRLEVSVESPPDRKRLVSSILVDGVQMAEINQETDELLVEVYPRQDGQPWTLRFNDLVHLLAKAKERLGR